MLAGAKRERQKGKGGFDAFVKKLILTEKPTTASKKEKSSKKSADVDSQREAEQGKSAVSMSDAGLMQLLQGTSVQPVP